MTNEERFKKNLEDLLAAKDFSFDEANWAKARDLIDTSKEKKRRRVVPFFILGLLLITGLGTGVYLLSEVSSPADKTLSETKTNLNSQENKTPVSETNAKPEFNAKITTPSLQTPAGERAPLISKEPVSSDEVKPVEKVTEAKVKQAEVKAHVDPEIKVAEELPLVLPAIPTKEKTKPKSHKKEKAKISDDNLPLAKTTVFPVEQSAPAAAKSDEQAVVTTPKTDVKVAEDSKDKTQETQKPSEQKSDAVVKSSNPPLQDKKDETQEVVSASEIKPDDGAGKKEESSLTQPVANTPDTSKTAQRDSIQSKPADNADGELGKTKERVVLFSVEAGANYMLGWKNSSGRDANGIDPVIGFNYFNNFKSKMALTVGLQYTSVSKLSYSNYTSKVVRLALGEESKVSVFTPTKLHYVIMPLRFEYSLNPKNAFGIGCNVAYLLNVQSNVETYREKMGTRYDVSTSKEKGYTKGFKPYDTQVSLFYKRTLHPNFAVNMEFYYGFTDIKDNTFFNTHVMERNTGAKLTLVYNFLKK